MAIPIRIFPLLKAYLTTLNFTSFKIDVRFVIPHCLTPIFGGALYNFGSRFGSGSVLGQKWMVFSVLGSVPFGSGSVWFWVKNGRFGSVSVPEFWEYSDL